MTINTEKYWEELSNLSSELCSDIDEFLIEQPDNTLDISKANICIDGSKVVSLHLANEFDIICTLKNGETYNLYQCDIFDILLVAEAINEIKG